MSLKLIVVELCLPVVVCLGLVLAVPHIIAKSIVPALGTISSAHRLIHFSTCLCTVMFIMAALCNRGPLYFCPVVSIFFLLSFFPRLISAIADWMSTVLRQMVWP